MNDKMPFAVGVDGDDTLFQSVIILMLLYRQWASEYLGLPLKSIEE